MAEMVWLKRPKFFGDGSWTLEKIREVPASSMHEGWTMTHEEFYRFWGQPIPQSLQTTGN